MRALLIGRFQPFHKGHTELVKYVLEKYGELVIIIGSAQESYTFHNPFTAGERYLMIYKAMEEIKIEKCHVIPVPDINRYGVYASHIIDLSPKFDVVLSNNALIKEIFEKDDINVIETPMFEREKYSGTEIRRRMAEGEKWEHLVPEAVARTIKEIKGDERIRKLYQIK
ncbi:MAG: nicotinamide-nucleotide adenylyltransferase [Candidatus Thermoplasmatota archaeon]|nr:nicotinamide-nucleotide adenylyltransferase [Candidatus Thermoplasmatota archaeon]